jgi:hypothetical protein
MIKQSHHMIAPVKQEHSELAHEIIGRIKSDHPSTKHISDLTELIIDLTESGMRFYFIESLERLNVGAVTMGIAKVGISSTTKGMKMVITKVLKKLDSEQISELTTFLDEIICRAEPDSK